MTSEPTEQKHEEDSAGRSEGIEPSLMDNVLYVLVWTIGRIASHLYLRLSIKGAENIPPTGPLMVVSNHASVMDPPLIAFMCSSRRIFFLAKAELFHNRLFGWFIGALGAFSVKRGASDRSALRTCATMLNAGKALLIFPEGTRTRDGHMQEPQSGAAMILGQAPDTVILPVRLEGTFEAWGPGRKFPLPRKVRIFVGKPFTVSEIKDPPTVKKQLYHAISNEIMSRISSA